MLIVFAREFTEKKRNSKEQFELAAYIPSLTRKRVELEEVAGCREGPRKHVGPREARATLEDSLRRLSAVSWSARPGAGRGHRSRHFLKGGCSLCSQGGPGGQRTLPVFADATAFSSK